MLRSSATPSVSATPRNPPRTAPLCQQHDGSVNPTTQHPPDLGRRAALLSLGITTSLATLPQPASSAAAPAPSPPAPFCGLFDSTPSWAFTAPWNEVPVDFRSYSTWTRRIGARNLDWFGRPYNKRIPTLVLHDLGLSSDSTATLEILAAADRQLVFYDQLGCGKSDLMSRGRAVEGADATLEAYVAQLQRVVADLKLDAFHVYGHGFGGMLAAEAASAGQLPGARSLTLVSTPLSYGRLLEDRAAALQQLPQAAQDTLRDLDGRGRGDPTWEAAWEQYAKRFLCHDAEGRRTCFARGEASQSGAVVSAFTGGRYFSAGGALEGWELSEERLGGVKVPTLLVRGADDALSAAHMQDMAAGLSAAGNTAVDMTTFADSGSFVHLDAYEPLLERLDSFEKRVEG